MSLITKLILSCSSALGSNILKDAFKTGSKTKASEKSEISFPEILMKNFPLKFVLNDSVTLQLGTLALPYIHFN